MTALLNWQKFLIDKTATSAVGRYERNTPAFDNAKYLHASALRPVYYTHFGILEVDLCFLSWLGELGIFC
ncbi:MAG TPA: hypothetical protein DET40_25930 [Lentisphaeria bacterium]|nr:MAG: hypothetical protein A2X45_15020 [Lentisphaerae bacterium GWF2_50_93]HCE47002.1 hypothetical protein [Lentisphaeria bacterium]